MFKKNFSFHVNFQNRPIILMIILNVIIERLF